MTLPPVWARVRFEENVELSEETSKFEGAETVMSASRSVPLTVKDCAEEALPEVAVKPVRLEGVAEMVGASASASEKTMAWRPWLVLIP